MYYIYLGLNIYKYILYNYVSHILHNIIYKLYIIYNLFCSNFYKLIFYKNGIKTYMLFHCVFSLSLIYF